MASRIIIVNLSQPLAWASAFLVAAALFYAPLAYGCTPPEMLPTLYVLLIGATALGALGFLVNRTWPAIPPLVILCVVGLIAQGWWLTWDPVLPTRAAENGGTLDTSLAELYRLSSASMLLTTVLTATFLVLCGLMGNVFIRRFLLMSAAGSGVLVCVVGVVLKTVGAPLMKYIWKPFDIYWNDFAFFRYHGNAGSFLILVWPLILVFTRRAYAPQGGLFKKAVWTVASAMCAVSLFLNASKAALIIGILILPWPFLTLLLRMKREAQAVLAGSTLVLVTGGMLMSGQFAHEAAFERLTNGQEVSGSVHGRIDAYADNLRAVPDAGLFGYGPGMFQVAFPYQNCPMRNVGEPMRNYAHEDYLQTAIEWGWLGTLAWSVLVFGGLWRGFHTYRQRSYFTSKTERHLVLAAILGICGTLAQALVDFPLQIASLRLFFLLYLALCWASPQLLTIPSREKRQRFRLPVPAEYAGKR